MPGQIELRYHLLHECMMESVVQVDMSGHIQEFNSAYQSMLGYSADELRQKTYQDLTPEKWHAMEQTIIQDQVLPRGYSEVYEKEYRRKDGTIFPVELRTILLRDETGVAVGMWAILRDTTNRKKAGEALQESEEKFRVVSENARAIFGIIQGDRFIYANPYLAELSGYTVDEILSMDFSTMIHPSFRPEVIERSRKRMAGEPAPTHYEFIMLTKTGESCWLDFSAERIELNGKPAIIGTAFDITERKKAEQALKERLQFEALVSDLSARFVNIPTDQVGAEIEQGLRQVIEFLEVERCGLLKIRRDKASWQVIHAAVTEGVPPVPLRTELPVSIYPWTYDKLVRKREVLAFSRIDELPAEADVDRQTWAEWGIRSFLYVPIIIDDAVAYVIAMDSIKSERAWPEELIPRVRLLGEIFLNALERAQMQQQLQVRYQEIQELKQRLERENVYLREEVKVLSEQREIVGESEAIKRVLADAEKVAPTDSTVLILGETGTGKELVARHIHNLSRRKDRPLVTVNCASLPPSLIESEIFGRERGAYTGALTRMAGRFEAADGSTLFLDEIGELPYDVQSKLLRVLEEGKFERLGSTKTVHADVRLIAATNRDLAADVSRGKFRSDLYYRLHVFPISIPPLRDRPEDIPSLVWTFVREFEKRLGKRIESISRKSMESLQQYAWPGNIRELKNVVEHAMIVCEGKALVVAPPASAAVEEAPSSTLQEIERRHICRTLEGTGWRLAGKNGAAELLGMKRTTLQAKMRMLGIRRPSS